MSQLTPSDRIGIAIKNKGFSYGLLSKETGISKSALQRYATGNTKKIPVDAAEKIANALNVSAAWIMGWEDDDRVHYKKVWGNNLRLAREGAGMSQLELTNRFNDACPPKDFEDYKTADDIDAAERGLVKLSYGDIMVYSKILGVSPDEIQSGWASHTWQTEGRKHEITEAFDQLSESSQEDLCEYAKFLLEKERRRRERDEEFGISPNDD